MELKAKGVDDVYLEYFNTGKHNLAQVYLKVEADQYIAELKKEIDRCHKYHDEQATKWLAENQKLKDEISKLKHLTQRHETATFYRMISEHEHSSAYGTNGENCIEDFASNITFCHTVNKYWKLVKGGKTIAREAIYQGE